MKLRYGWESGTAPKSLDYVLPAVLRVLQERGIKRVLDVGAGNGAMCRELNRSGYEVVGIEPDLEGVTISRRLCPGVRFYMLGVDQAPDKVLADYPDGFDAIVSTEVIEHLYYPRRLPEFVYPLLRDDGTFVITTPYHGYLKNLAIALTGGWDRHADPLWDGGHIKFFSRRTITQLLEETGFEVEYFGGVGRLPLLWKSMVVCAFKTTTPKQCNV